jgi:AcrR family transcriptional regulator
MARPQSPDYDKRRDAIVAAAAALYARRGFQGASVADLAKACGASKSLVYHYFPSKEDILHEVMSSHLELLVEAAEEVMQRQDFGPRERLHALSLAFMRLYAGAADSHKVLLNELDNLPAGRRADVVAKQRRIIAMVEDQIRRIRPEAAAVAFPVTMLFFGMINWTHTWFHPEGPITPEELADMAVNLMLDGLPGVAPEA